MEMVGLRELKTHLGSYIAKARAGEHIVVTNRGKHVAEIGPLSPERELILALYAQGKIRRLAEGPMELPERLHIEGFSLSDAVIEERRHQ